MGSSEAELGPSLQGQMPIQVPEPTPTDYRPTPWGQAARRMIADCDEKLAAHRRGLEGGAPGEVVGVCIAEFRGERLAAEPDFARASSAERPTEAEIRELFLAPTRQPGAPAAGGVATGRRRG